MNPADRRTVTASAAPTVHLIGAGPGDPELLTRKAVRCLRQADVILVDDLVSDACLRFARSSCRIVRVGKRGGCRSTPQAFIEKLLIREARRGQRVVRLKGGDPMVFGRAGEEIAALRAAGLRVEVVPGITAASAAAAALAASLTHRDHAPGVALITGHRQPGAGPTPWAELARSGLTLAVYMGLTQAARIETDLLDAGLPATTPVCLVQAVSTAAERRVATTLGALAATVHDQRLASPCVVLIGEAMRLAVAADPHVDARSEPASRCMRHA